MLLHAVFLCPAVLFTAPDLSALQHFAAAGLPDLIFPALPGKQDLLPHKQVQEHIPQLFRAELRLLRKDAHADLVAHVPVSPEHDALLVQHFLRYRNELCQIFIIREGKSLVKKSRQDLFRQFLLLFAQAVQ